MKKLFSSLFAIVLLAGLFTGTMAFSASASVSVDANGYYSEQTSAKFSEGESASITFSVDTLGTDWYTSGLTIAVTPTLQTSMANEVWQTTGADGVFTFSFQANADNQMVGVIYRSGAGTGTTAAADWAKVSLQGDITVEVKQNANGVTALYLNGAEWVPYAETGLSIPDGYLALATAAGSKVTVAQQPTDNDDGEDNKENEGEEGDNVIAGADGYYSEQTSAKFSEGESASITFSVDTLGTDWYTSGLTIAVTPTLQTSMANEVWQSTGADGVFTFSFQANADNQMVGVIYRSGAGTGTTAAADWAKVSLQGDITVEVKQNANGVTALYLNGAEWTPYAETGLSIPDGYLALATAASSKVTVAQQPTDEDDGEDNSTNNDNTNDDSTNDDSTNNDNANNDNTNDNDTSADKTDDENASPTTGDTSVAGYCFALTAASLAIVIVLAKKRGHISKAQ